MSEPEVETHRPESPRKGRIRARLSRLRRLRPLPLPARILLFLAGWLLVLVGIVALVLPGPGLLTIFLGASLLSLVSELVYERLRWVLSRWPAMQRRLEGLRLRLHRRLRSRKPPPASP
jgi:uncharacterized protein (TIGR02611 family)